MQSTSLDSFSIGNSQCYNGYYLVNSAFKGVYVMKLETQIVVEVEDKGHVVVNKCSLPDPLNMTVVRLDLKHGGESRYRFRLEDGVEGRVSVSKLPHYQQNKRHQNNSIYVVHKGWIAILTQEKSSYRIKIAFARNNGNFYVEVPGGEWYAAYLSENVVFTYSSSDTDTGDIREHETELPTEEEILSIYREQEALSEDEILELVKNSYPD